LISCDVAVGRVADMSEGQQIKRFITTICPHCGRSVDLPPGRLDDNATEIRVCPDCGKDVPSSAWFTAPPSQDESGGIGPY
jgi:endogenous inhibitor of DNA gyrase (YacG/DUF329 family)